MNYLAHAYLSFNNTEILLGNMMADFVKGKHQLIYPLPIQQGFKLHKSIDLFTDNHELVKQSVAIFHAQFKMGSGIFNDILFDHFLANDARYFDDVSLQKFTQNVYQTLQSNSELFVEKMIPFFGYMQQYDWLYHYKDIAGLQKSIHGICKRYPKLGNADEVMICIDKNYDCFQTYYFQYFPLLEKMVLNYEI